MGGCICGLFGLGLRFGQRFGLGFGFGFGLGCGFGFGLGFGGDILFWLSTNLVKRPRIVFWRSLVTAWAAAVLTSTSCGVLRLLLGVRGGLQTFIVGVLLGLFFFFLLFLFLDCAMLLFLFLNCAMR